MKKLQFLAFTLATALCGSIFSSCSEDDPVIDNPNKEETEETHFDVWVGIGETGGMGKETTLLVKGLTNLSEQTTIDFKNDGADVTADMDQESIIKGKYYYQVANSADRFVKFQIVGNELRRVAEQPFVKNTYKDRRYTHAWIDDNTLVILAANGSANKILWTKLNAEDLRIIEEGELSLVCPEGDKFSTSGLARYRKSDNKIIYFFQHKNEETNFYAAFINPSDMSVEKEVKEDRADQMAGTAYGELLQNKMFFDENDNLYLACNNRIPNSPKTSYQYGRLLRINKGEMDFDKSYLGYNYDQGKLVTVDYLGNNKALLYIQDPVHCGLGEDAWGSNYNCYYAVLDLATDQKTEIQADGKNLPFCSGTFSQRSYVTTQHAYIGVNPETSAPCVYVYDINSGKATKGITITEGYDFSRLVLIDNDK